MGIVQWTFRLRQQRERFLDIDGTERFVSQWPWQMRSICIDEFYGDGRRKRGNWFNDSRQARGDASFFVSATVFMRRNVLTVVLIGSGVWYVEACVSKLQDLVSNLDVSMCITIRSFDSTCNTTYPRVYTMSWTQVARVFYRSSIIL